MKFAVISPTAGLQRYSTRSNLQMALAHLMKGKEYWEFYVKRREMGDTIILDNGAYENGVPLSAVEMEGIMYHLQPQIVVLPDYLMQEPRRTVSAALRFLDHMAERWPEVEWMYVPQAPPYEIIKVLQSISAVVEDNRVGQYVKWIGLGRFLHTHYNGMRAWFAMKVREMYPELKIHALGSASGSVDEFNFLEKIGVESMDSSSPVWRGWQGYSIHNPEWPDFPVDFGSVTMPEEGSPRDTVIWENLKHFGVTQLEGADEESGNHTGAGDLIQ